MSPTLPRYTNKREKTNIERYMTLILSGIMQIEWTEIAKGLNLIGLKIRETHAALAATISCLFALVKTINATLNSIVNNNIVTILS